MLVSGEKTLLINNLSHADCADFHRSAHTLFMLAIRMVVQWELSGKI